MHKLNDFTSTVGQRLFDPNTTKSQLLTEPIIVASWGAHDWGFFKNDHLIFKVNGALHKGFVVIILEWEDLYKVYLLDENIRQTVPSIGGIYADSLVEVIDNLVETPR